MNLLPDFLTNAWMGKPLWMWAGFVVFVLTVLVLDLGLLHRKAHEVSAKESLFSTLAYMGIGCAFTGVIYWLYLNNAPVENLDPRLAIDDAEARAALAAQLYLTGYLVEQTLSMDNVFVMSMIFGYFAIPRKYQHRVLFWGILGVIIFRAIMIFAGAAMISKFHWVLYLFAIFLIVTGIRMLVAAGKDNEMDVSQNPVLRLMRRIMPVTHDLHGDHFFVRQRDPKTNRMITYATPLFLALVVIEFADLIFAVDSVPAVLALTQDPYLVYTSNIFAILGLRTLYFSLAAMVHRFKYLEYSLSIVLVFIGAKIFLAHWMEIPGWLSLGVTVGLLGGGVAYSIYKTGKEDSA